MLEYTIDQLLESNVSGKLSSSYMRRYISLSGGKLLTDINGMTSFAFQEIVVGSGATSLGPSN